MVSPEKIPPDVITINSQVRIRDLDAGRQTVYTLVFPRDADVAKNRISVFAPFGAALLGYRVGELLECAAPGVGKRLRVRKSSPSPTQPDRSLETILRLAGPIEIRSQEYPRRECMLTLRLNASIAEAPRRLLQTTIAAPAS